MRAKNAPKPKGLANIWQNCIRCFVWVGQCNRYCNPVKVGMKHFFLVPCLTVLLWLGLSQPSWAAIQSDVDLLLDTKECPVCILDEADLSGRDLRGSNLKIATLTDANLSGADLSNANLILAFMDGINLSGATLHGANLNGAQLSKANFSGADLTKAELSQANLLDADLSGADLEGAVLVSAKLGTANLKGANLKDANLRGVNRSMALFCDTVMPDGTIASRDCE